MIHTKKRQGQNNWEDIDIGNTIEYDVKSYQVKTTIVKCTKLKHYWILTAHRKRYWYIQRKYDAIR